MTRGYFIELERVNSQVVLKQKRGFYFYSLFIKYFLNLIFNVAKIYILKNFTYFSH